MSQLSRWSHLTALLAAVAGCAAQNPRSQQSRAGGCSELTPAPCEAACFTGDGAACAIFGAAVEGAADPPVRLPQDMPRGRKALDKGCKLGSLAACRALASYDTDDAAPGADCAAWEAICKRGDRPSCTFFAQCLDWTEGFRRDRDQALRIYRDGCDHGERVACRQLGLRVMNGDGVPKDLERGFALLDRACRMDDPFACAQVGLRLERGQWVARDLARAKAQYRMACARGIRPIPCEGLRRLGETPPSTTVSSADGAESNYVSASTGFEWRIPANWQFVPASSITLADVPDDAEVVAARPRSASEHDSLMFSIGTCAKDTGPDGLERDALTWLTGHRVAKTASARERYWGHYDAVRVEARLPPPDNRFLTLSLFCKNERRFEARCLSTRRPPNLPCRDALGALVFQERTQSPENFPRVLHLREKRFGLSFDAPDDAWLGVGPRQSIGYLSWYWYDGDRNIDLMVTPMGAMIDDVFANVTIDAYRTKGATVTRTEAEIAGFPCIHLVVDKKDATAEDVFVQRRGDIGYVVTVTAPKRDADLLAKVRAGLRFGAAQR